MPETYTLILREPYTKTGWEWLFNVPQSLLQRHYTKGLQHFYGKGPQPLLRAGSWNAHEKMTISSISTHLNDRVIFTVCTQLKNVAVGRRLETNVLHYKYEHYAKGKGKVHPRTVHEGPGGE